MESIATHDFLKVCALIHSGFDKRANPNQGTLLLHVKWKGYDKVEDMTWEPEENLKYVYECLDGLNPNSCANTHA